MIDPALSASNARALLTITISISSSFTCLSNEIHDLQVKLRGIHGELKLTGSTSEQSLARQESAIRETQRKIEELQAFQQHSLAAQNQRFDERERRMLASNTQFFETQRKIEIKLDTFQAAAVLKTAQGLTIAPRQSSPAADSRSAHSVMVAASFVPWRCSDHCTCVCHRRYTKRSPQFLNRVFGLLFLGYAGLPIMTPSCDSKECIQRASSVTMVSYRFPLWLLTRVVSFTIRLSNFEGPQFSLRVSRVIDGSSQIFGYIQHGQVNRVREVLQKRLITPFDISHTSGLSALMVGQPEPS